MTYDYMDAVRRDMERLYRDNAGILRGLGQGRVAAVICDRLVTCGSDAPYSDDPVEVRGFLSGNLDLVRTAAEFSGVEPDAVFDWLLYDPAECDRMVRNYLVLTTADAFARSRAAAEVRI